MNERIGPSHLCRKAILYVRQSTPYQVMHNQESQRLQYGMKHRLGSLGWQAVDVIDEDLGVTATGSATRNGFERMVAQVCMGEVGVVAARELSRFARNSRQWQQLIEVCRVVDTILVDHESIYDARRGNDRLLLGLKGSLNEYELDVLRMRSLEARYAKAQRGELIIVAPVDYVKTTDQRLEKAPDQRVVHAIGLVFSKFLELGSIRQTLNWFLEQAFKLPCLSQASQGWQTRWRRPRYAMLQRILRDPVYAGVYAYGKSRIECHYDQGVLRRQVRRLPPDEWRVKIPNHHEAYLARLY
jgi:DNA invertase Pin-like site-specific DNA recombinase